MLKVTQDLASEGSSKLQKKKVTEHLARMCPQDASAAPKAMQT